MTEDGGSQFPLRSLNDVGEITDIDLWVDEFEAFFDHSILSEIRSTIAMGLTSAPYILISCAIDFLVSYCVGSDSTATYYTEFVNTFFKGYDGELLYKELRCRMVHNHTVGRRAIVCWNEPDLHRESIDGTTIVLNLEEFFEDFVEAKSRYFSALRSSPDLLSNHIRRFNELGVLVDVDADEVRKWVASR